VEERQESTEVAGEGTRVTLLGDNKHVIAVGADKLKVTVLLKPFSAVKVTVEFPCDPALRVRLVRLAVIVKSTTWNVIVAL
jgi:hypothetical protein